MEHQPFKLVKKGKYWHYVIHINGIRMRGSTRAISKELAVQYANKKYRDLYQSNHELSTPKITIKEFIIKHLQRGRNNLSLEWLYTKERILDNFLHDLRIKYLNEIKLEHLETYKSLQLEKNKPISQYQIL